MRTIERTSAFKRDYKRERKGAYRTTLESDLRPVLESLALNKALEPRYRDHALTGDWKNYRDCHVKPDLVLIYRFLEEDRLVLARLGFHSELNL